MLTFPEIPRISHDEYIRWRDLIQEKSSLYLKENQLDFLKRRLWDRMRKLSVGTYSEYYSLIKEGSDTQEWRQLLETLVNSESSFFRHKPSFKALRDKVLPELLKKRMEDDEPCLSLWSAAASKGQEAYSLAMTFAETVARREAAAAKHVGCRVIGTDISREALAKAEKGEYSTYDIRGVPQAMIDKHMALIGDRPGSSIPAGSALVKHFPRYRVKDAIRRNVRFEYLNFSEPHGFSITMQDVIFCQNLFIYFHVQDRIRTILMLLKQLKPGGYLFLAPGEGVGVKVDGATIVRFKDAPAYKRNKEALHVRAV